MRQLLLAFAIMAIIARCLSGGDKNQNTESQTYENAYDSTSTVTPTDARPNPETQTYENEYNSVSTVTPTETDDPYLENKLQTGSVPYSNYVCKGEGSTISL